MFGFSVKQGSVSVSPKRGLTFREYPRPTNAAALSRFIKSAGYFRSLIPNFAAYEGVFNKCIREWNWTGECEAKFKKLRELIGQLPTVYPWKPGNALEVFADASLGIIGGVLLQVWPDGKRLQFGFIRRCYLPPRRSTRPFGVSFWQPFE